MKPLGPSGAQKGASMRLKLEGDKNKKQATDQQKHKDAQYSISRWGHWVVLHGIGHFDWLRPEAAAAGWTVVR